MPRFILVLLGFALVSMLTSCGGGGGSSTTPAPDSSSSIKGPQTVTEGSSAEYRVERAASSPARYQWTVSPGSIGQFSDPQGQTTKFTAGTVTKDTQAQIKVTSTPDKGTAQVSSVNITIKDAVTVGNKPPVANAQVDPTSTHPGGSIQFTDKSVDPDGSSDIVKWEWDFSYDSAQGFLSDNQTQSPSFTFATEGEFLVQLRVTDRAGLTDMLDEPIHILVTSGHLAPVAKALCYPNPVKVCEAVQFQNDGSYAQDKGSIIKYEWDWDNDGTYDTNGLFSAHTWTKPGSYSVQFRVTDSAGASMTLPTPMIVVVEGSAPIAQASVSDGNPTVGQNVTFDAGGSYDTDCNGGSITKWEWDWDNDGVFEDSGSYVIRYFDYPGVHNVMMRVTDDEGDTDSIDTPITVNVLPGNSYVWGGIGHDSAYGVAVDSDGSIYVTGRFANTADFDPSVVDNSVTTPATSGAFLSKFDSSKNLAWVTTWGDTGENSGNDVFVSTGGNIYVAGTTTVIKFNTLGQILWKYDGGKIGEGVAVDDSTGVWVAGHFDPTGSTKPDAFLANLTSDGVLNWERVWGSTGCDQAWDVGTDASGNGYTVGHFDGTVDLDPGTTTAIYTASDLTDSFLSKFSPTGDLTWVRVWGATDTYGLAVAPCGTIYVTGYYEGTTDFDPGPGVVTCTGEIGSYLSAFTVEGDFSWATGWSVYNPPPPPTHYDPGYAVTSDLDGNVYVAGSFEGTVDFDPSGYQDIHDNGGAYVVKYSSTGSYDGVKTWGAHYGTDWDTAWSVAIDGSGNAVVAGDYVGMMDFGIDSQEIRTARGDYDAFLLNVPKNVTW